MTAKSMQLAGQQTSRFKTTQAINEDYRNTGFDRGHLNPNFYQCDDSRTATFTLTNAVPQDPCFNQQSWKKMEEVSLRTMRTSCSFPGAKRFFVTGVVRSRSRIPNENHDNEGDRTRVYNRVTVPSHMWTAVCCDASEADAANQNNGFSFAYIGKNTADSFVDILTVSDLQAKLSSNELGLDRYESVKIFTDDCSENSQKSKRMRAQVTVPMDIRVANAVDSLSKVEQSTIPLKKRKLVNQAVTLIGSKKVAAFNYSLVRLDLGITLARNNILLHKTRQMLQDEGAGLLLFRPHDLTSVPRPPTEELDSNRNISAYGNDTASTKQNTNMEVLARRDGMDDDNKKGGANDQVVSLLEDEYLMVQDVSAEGSDITIGGDRCITSSCGYSQGTKYRWCYTDHSNNYDYCCANKCMFRNNGNNPTCSVGDRIRACSIRSSIITVKGNRCLPGHECGLHGESYYWCYTDIAKNYDSCCQPWHACAKYGQAKKWCYTGNTKESTKEDCFY